MRWKKADKGGNMAVSYSHSVSEQDNKDRILSYIVWQGSQCEHNAEFVQVNIV